MFGRLRTCVAPLFLPSLSGFILAFGSKITPIEEGDSRETVEGFIAATTITNIYYIVRRAAGREVAQNAITQVLSDLNICAVDLGVLEQALALNFEDFEDAVQYACAVAHNVDAIVTRDTSGFVNVEIPVVLPDELDTISPCE